jgi:hypothetical protein
MELTTTNNRVPNSGSWKPGQSGNMNGRPIGSRHIFSKAFLRDLAEVWSAEGRQAMLITAKTVPATFFAVCARLIPSNVELTINEGFGALSPDDYAVLKAIRESVPDANNQSPQAVFDFVKQAVQAHSAKLIEAPRNK